MRVADGNLAPVPVQDQSAQLRRLIGPSTPLPPCFPNHRTNHRESDLSVISMARQFIDRRGRPFPGRDSAPVDPETGWNRLILGHSASFRSWSSDDAKPVLAIILLPISYPHQTVLQRSSNCSAQRLNNRAPPTGASLGQNNGLNPRIVLHSLPSRAGSHSRATTRLQIQRCDSDLEAPQPSHSQAFSGYSDVSSKLNCHSFCRFLGPDAWSGSD